jgi:translation initiation factor 2B subunit (eIF-2B alpha/beta/delta family)
VWLILKEKRGSTYKQVIAAINRIGEDNESGAAEILRRAAEVFSLLAASQTEKDSSDTEKDSGDTESARNAIIETCAALAESQPDMAPLTNLANEVSAVAGQSAGAGDVFRLALETARGFIEAAARAAKAATSHAARLVHEGATLMTHSRSSTVLAAFLEARRAGNNFSVIATESRPMLEGQRLAEALAREGVRVTLIADSAAALMMKRVDFVLLGADRLAPEFLVNKIGTRMITLAARERGVPVYALCDTSKFTCAVETPGSKSESRNRDELWPDAPENVLVLNRYFEPTPLIYFTSIITEDGPLQPEQARLRAEAKSRLGLLAKSE